MAQVKKVTHPTHFTFLESPGMLEIRIPFIGSSTNTIYAGMHWRKRKKEVDLAHWIVKQACKGAKKFDRLVDLEFTPYPSTRRLDTSNYSYTCKMIEDGLVMCKVLQGDGQKHVAGFYINPPVKIKHGEESYMVVKITERKEKVL